MNEKPIGTRLRCYALLACTPFLAGCDVTFIFEYTEAGYLLEATVTAAVWAIANIVYFEQKRRGISSWSRFFAFWLGNPTTWVTFFVLPEGSETELAPPPDDEASLFREVRKDRMLRSAAGDGTSVSDADGPDSDEALGTG